MSSTPIEVGTELPPVEQVADLATSTRYAGASGDFNPLHFDPAFAEGVSPTGDVIAHGMFAMGVASRMLTAFAGGPERVADISVRFTRPWPLGTVATFSGKVTAVDADTGTATVSLSATGAEGSRILRGTAHIRR